MFSCFWRRRRRARFYDSDSDTGGDPRPPPVPLLDADADVDSERAESPLSLALYAPTRVRTGIDSRESLKGRPTRSEGLQAFTPKRSRARVPPYVQPFRAPDKRAADGAVFERYRVKRARRASEIPLRPDEAPPKSKTDGGSPTPRVFEFQSCSDAGTPDAATAAFERLSVSATCGLRSSP